MGTLAQGITWEVSKDGKTLTLVIHLKPGKLTEKGNRILATTGGNQSIGDMKVGLNVYRPEK